MRALDKKLLRELWRLRGQVLAIGLVVASGVGVLIMSLGAIESLEETARAYYERYNFADVFANVRRAPDHLQRRIAGIPGVQAVETRVVEYATLDIPGFEEPVTGQFVSIPEGSEPAMNRLALRSGRTVAPARPDEVVISEPFADAQGLRSGDSFVAIINGHRRRLTIVGIALSPEFVYSIGPGALMPDDKRFGAIWMGREALAAAYDLEGAFNNVTLTLLRGANEQAVIDRLDALLAPYGSVGAIARKNQISNWFLMNEIEQLRNMMAIMPTIFLVVAAFLANMVLGRLIAVERAEIGLLKAFGYSDAAVGWHYAKLVMAMTLVGVVLGWATGYGMGRYTTEIYTEFYRFPFLYYRPSLETFAIGAMVSLAATLIGAGGAVRRAVRLPPAEAMRPPAPPDYRRGRVGPAWLGKWIDQPTRIVLRQILRWPRRSFLTAFGIGMAVALLVMSNQWIDAVNHMIQIYFREAQHQNVTVTLEDVRSSRALRELGHLPGVLTVEGMRTVPVRYRAGTRTHRDSIQGVAPDARLSLVYDNSGSAIRVPREGLVMSTKLAEVLGVGVGDTVRVEVLERHRPVREVPVVRLFDTYIATPGYMHIDAVHELMREGSVVNYIHMLVDPAYEGAIYRQLKNIPAISGVLLRRAAIAVFEDTMAKTVLIYVFIFVGFSCALAFGVVYNSARIALSERGRELATLRVIGFTRFEISYILLGELAFLTFGALPLGCFIGWSLSRFLTATFDTELYRVPSYVELSTYGLAAAIGLAATVVSAAVVRRRLDSLDLIAVLKTRE